MHSKYENYISKRKEVEKEWKNIHDQIWPICLEIADKVKKEVDNQFDSEKNLWYLVVLPHLNNELELKVKCGAYCIGCLIEKWEEIENIIIEIASKYDCFTNITMTSIRQKY